MNLFGLLSLLLLLPVFPTLRIMIPLFTVDFVNIDLTKLYGTFIVWYTMSILLWVITAIISAVTKSDSFINECIISCGEKFTNKNVNKNNKNKYNLL